MAFRFLPETLLLNYTH